MTLLARSAHPLVLEGVRVRLRTLGEGDFEAWQEVRVRCRDWLLPWEPRPAGAPPMREDRATYSSRCSARDRERQMGTGYGFGIFLRFEEDGMPRERFVGEINLSSIQRGPFQSGHLGYWIDQSYAGRGLIPEAVVVMFRFAFEELGLHRVQVSIIPRNRASRRVAAKLGLRDEGIAVRYLEIDGRWEDHIRYAITAEEWLARRQQYLEQWLTS
jgi:ribosomal-protein-alanine N-acetyltransferase